MTPRVCKHSLERVNPEMVLIARRTILKDVCVYGFEMRPTTITLTIHVRACKPRRRGREIDIFASELLLS